MFCLATRLKTAPANLDKVVQICQDAVPLAASFPGFKGFYVMTKATGEFMIMDIFDTEAQTMAYLKSPKHAEIAKQLGPLFAGPPASDNFEVRVAAAKA